MAGHPKRKRILAAMARLAFESERDVDWVNDATRNATVLEWACEQIASGKNIAQLARELEAVMHETVTRQSVSTILHGLSADADQRLSQAQQDGASALAEEALYIVDTADISSREAFQRDKARADLRMLQAGKRDKATWGDTPAVQIGINAGSLHLDALRAVQPRTLTLATSAALPSGSPQEAESDDEAVEIPGSAA